MTGGSADRWQGRLGVALAVLGLAAWLGLDGRPFKGHLWPAARPRLRLEGLYITQGSQRLDQSVPLVQGKCGWLRAFATARAWRGAAPAMRVLIQGPDQATLLDAVVPGPPAVPRTVDEAALDGAWNLRLPGRFIQPGNTVLARLDWPDAAGGSLVFPPSGRPLPMTVVPVAPLAVRLLQVRSHGLAGRALAPGRTLDAWKDPLFRQFPLDRIDLSLGAFQTTQDLGTGRGRGALLGELETARLASGRDDATHFYGVLPGDLAGRAWLRGGLGILPGDQPGRLGRSAIGGDGDGTGEAGGFQDTFVREMGHSLGLLQAPDGADGWAADPDPLFPYPDGGIGACGFDIQDGVPKDPGRYKDTMGEGLPRWSSDYDIRRILAYRAGESPDPLPGPARDCLLVRGCWRDGRIALQPAFRVRRPPLLPEPGELVLSALASGGRVLACVPFDIPLLEEEPGQPRQGSFAFVLPLDRAGQAALAALRVTRNGTVLAELRAPRPARPLRLRVGRRGGGLQLRWDPRAEAMVRDPAGEVLAMAPGGRLDLAGGPRNLRCLFSDGLHTREVRLSKPVRARP